MSISVSVGFMIPANVVEVGNEITSDQLAAITSATTPTSANPFLTTSAAASFLPLAGGTLTGSLVLDDPVIGFPATLTGAGFSFDGGLAINIEEAHIDGFNINLPASGTITGCNSITGCTSIFNSTNLDLSISVYNDTGAGTTFVHTFDTFTGTFELATNGGGLTFPDSTTQTTAAVAPPSADVLTANAIASNVGSMGYGTSTWAGTSQPAIASLVSWGIYNPTDGYIAHSSSSGSSFYLVSTPTTLINTSIQVNGSNSSFYVA